jgi:hypothetical protein
MRRNPRPRGRCGRRHNGRPPRLARNFAGRGAAIRRQPLIASTPFEAIELASKETLAAIEGRRTSRSTEPLFKRVSIQDGMRRHESADATVFQCQQQESRPRTHLFSEQDSPVSPGQGQAHVGSVCSVFGLDIEGVGGDGGIRTLDRALQPYNGLAIRRRRAPMFLIIFLILFIFFDQRPRQAALAVPGFVTGRR